MSVGLLVVRLLDSLYVCVHLSKWFTFFCFSVRYFLSGRCLLRLHTTYLYVRLLSPKTSSCPHTSKYTGKFYLATWIAHILIGGRILWKIKLLYWLLEQRPMKERRNWDSPDGRELRDQTAGRVVQRWRLMRFGSGNSFLGHCFQPSRKLPASQRQDGWQAVPRSDYIYWRGCPP